MDDIENSLKICRDWVSRSKNVAMVGIHEDGVAIVGGFRWVIYAPNYGHGLHEEWKCLQRSIVMSQEELLGKDFFERFQVRWVMAIDAMWREGTEANCKHNMAIIDKMIQQEKKAVNAT